jgi:hypothetical protein
MYGYAPKRDLLLSLAKILPGRGKLAGYLLGMSGKRAMGGRAEPQIWNFR